MAEKYDVASMMRFTQRNMNWMNSLKERTNQPLVRIVNEALKCARTGKPFKMTRYQYYEEKLKRSRAAKRDQVHKRVMKDYDAD